MIPVVFFQVIKPFFVDIAIRQAIKNNDVHLIGDKDYGNGVCKFHDIKQWYDDVNHWLHKQRNGVYDISEFDTICMYRWVCILKLMEKIGADIVWACDSDVLLYANASKEHKRIGSPTMTLSQCPEGKAAGVESPLGHTGHSMVSADAVDMFVSRMHTFWNDMFAWTRMVYKEKVEFFDTATPKDGFVWDHHLGNDLAHYECSGKCKRVRFVDGMPVIRHNTLGDLKTPVLHCWTTAEERMPLYAKMIDV